jgi:hypothetical protein
MAGGALLASSAGAEPTAKATPKPEQKPAAKPGTKPAGGPLPHLTVDDPMAEGFAYQDDARKVDRKQFPAFTADQKCANCAQFKGKAGEQWAACIVIPGYLVNTAGWCQLYARKKA